jgi:hypothetical protein
MHYRDMPCHGIHESSFTASAGEAAWSTMAAALGLTGAAVGEKCGASTSVPPLSGTIAYVKHNEVILLLEKPAPGVGMFYAMPCGGSMWVGINFYLFGEATAEVVTRDQPAWRAWLDAHFPPASLSAATNSS